MNGSAIDTASLGLAIGLLVALGIVGLWDIYLAFAVPDGRSVSQILYAWGQKFPPLVLGIGILLGHLFWPVTPR